MSHGSFKYSETYFLALFFHSKNPSEILNYELLVYWQNIFAVYRTVTLLYLKVTMISWYIRSVT